MQVFSPFLNSSNSNFVRSIFLSPTSKMLHLRLGAAFTMSFAFLSSICSETISRGCSFSFILTFVSIGIYSSCVLSFTATFSCSLGISGVSVDFGTLLGDFSVVSFVFSVFIWYSSFELTCIFFTSVIRPAISLVFFLSVMKINEKRTK